MTQKLVISKPGYNAITETSVDNLVFSSDYECLKYYISGFAYFNASVPTGTTVQTVVINHNLGYIPFFQVYTHDLGTQRFLPNSTPTSVDTGLITAYATTTDLVLIMTQTNPTPASTDFIYPRFVYKIFLNDLGL